MKFSKVLGIACTLSGLLSTTVLGQEMPACAVSSTTWDHDQIMVLILPGSMSGEQPEGAGHLRSDKYNLYLHDSSSDEHNPRMRPFVMHLDSGFV
jgi:hypothetical protein